MTFLIEKGCVLIYIIIHNNLIYSKDMCHRVAKVVTVHDDLLTQCRPI